MKKLNKAELYRRTICGISVILGGIALAVCQEKEEGLIPTEPAEVVAHLYDDPDTWTTASVAGKMIITEEHYDPEHFYLELKQCETKELTGVETLNPDDCKSATVEVDVDTYSAYPDGSQIILDQI